MISLTRLNGTSFVLNALLIESVEATPDTIITLTTGKKYMVQEDAQEIVQRTTEFLAESRAIAIIPTQTSGG